MKKLMILALMVITLVVIMKSPNETTSFAVNAVTQQTGKSMKKSAVPTQNVIPFPVERSRSAVLSFDELEDKYQKHSRKELEIELAKVEEMMKSARLVELANENRLTQEGQNNLLHFIRSKAVITMRLFELSKQEEL